MRAVAGGDVGLQHGRAGSTVVMEPQQAAPLKPSTIHSHCAICSNCMQMEFLQRTTMEPPQQQKQQQK